MAGRMIWHDKRLLGLAPAVAPKPSTDWRVKLSLANSAYYLYESDTPGILAPLRETNGVIFPYTPTISINYNANYEQTDVTHSNFKFYQYKNSSVGEIQLQADFTAQDTNEANYLLAVIHFLRSATKMFYGQSQLAGTPPPMVFLNGYGPAYLPNVPCVVQSFEHTMPADVDYIDIPVATMVSSSLRHNCQFLLLKVLVKEMRLPCQMIPKFNHFY